MPIPEIVRLILSALIYALALTALSYLAINPPYPIFRQFAAIAILGIVILWMFHWKYIAARFAGLAFAMAALSIGHSFILDMKVDPEFLRQIFGNPDSLFAKSLIYLHVNMGQHNATITGILAGTGVACLVIHGVIINWDEIVRAIRKEKKEQVYLSGNQFWLERSSGTVRAVGKVRVINSTEKQITLSKGVVRKGYVFNNIRRPIVLYERQHDAEIYIPLSPMSPLHVSAGDKTDLLVEFRVFMPLASAANLVRRALRWKERFPPYFVELDWGGQHPIDTHRVYLSTPTNQATA